MPLHASQNAQTHSRGDRSPLNNRVGVCKPFRWRSTSH